MAERRMFAKTIIDSDAFLDMPLSAQALYFHLAMRADDEGFVNNPKKIQRMTMCSDDDLKILIAKSFLIVFETGVVVIKHWRIHNYLKNDRVKPTVYEDERRQITVKANGAYTLQTDCDALQEPVQPQRQRKKTRPTVEEVEAYCKERNNTVDAQRFVDYYERQGWVLSNGQEMKSWKAAVRTWEQRDKKESQRTYDAPEGFYA